MTNKEGLETANKVKERVERNRPDYNIMLERDEIESRMNRRLNRILERLNVKSNKSNRKGYLIKVNDHREVAEIIEAEYILNGGRY